MQVYFSFKLKAKRDGWGGETKDWHPWVPLPFQGWPEYHFMVDGASVEDCNQYTGVEEGLGSVKRLLEQFFTNNSCT